MKHSILYNKKTKRFKLLHNLPEWNKKVENNNGILIWEIYSHQDSLNKKEWINFLLETFTDPDIDKGNLMDFLDISFNIKLPLTFPFEKI